MTAQDMCNETNALELVRQAKLNLVTGLRNFGGFSKTKSRRLHTRVALKAADGNPTENALVDLEMQMGDIAAEICDELFLNARRIVPVSSTIRLNKITHATFATLAHNADDLDRHKWDHCAIIVVSQDVLFLMARDPNYNPIYTGGAAVNLPGCIPVGTYNGYRVVVNPRAAFSRLDSALICSPGWFEYISAGNVLSSSSVSVDPASFQPYMSFSSDLGFVIDVNRVRRIQVV